MHVTVTEFEGRNEHPNVLNNFGARTERFERFERCLERATMFPESDFSGSLGFRASPLYSIKKMH
jgi:hypothetical protein